MRIILISLLRAYSRRTLMQQRLQQLGLDFEILDATDGATITDEQRARVDHTARKCITCYPLSDNEIGCYFSHLRAIELIAHGPDAMGAILEDDVTLAPDLAAGLNAIEARGLPFDVITLHRTMKNGEIFAPCAELLPDLQLGRIGYTHMNLQGYVISRSGALRFLRHVQARGIGHAVDKEMHRYWANGLDIYGLSRPLVTHADHGHSIIDETRAPRAAYPDAGRLCWRWARFQTKIIDSIAKRWAFGKYVRQGKAAHR